MSNLEDPDIYNRIINFIYKKQEKYCYDKCIQLSYCYKNYLMLGCEYHSGIMDEIR